MNRPAQILGYGDSRNDNALLFSMQLVVITLPFAEYVNTWAIAIMTLIWLLTSDFSKVGFLQMFKERRLGVFFILYFIWLLLGLLYTADIAEGLQDINSKLPFLIFPFIVLYNKQINAQILQGIIRAFYGSMFLISIYLLIQSWLQSQGNHNIPMDQVLNFFTYENLASSFGIQPIYLSMYMVFSFFAIIWDFYIDPLKQSNKVLKWFAGFCALYFYLLVIMLSSRMELLVLLFITFVGISYFDGYKAKKWFAVLLKMAAITSFTILLLASVPVNKVRYQEMIDIENDYTKNQYGGRSIRIQKWLNTLELISMHPLLGTGAGDMQMELQKLYKKNNLIVAYDSKFNPHNQYLQTWASSGLIGIFLLLGILFASFLYSLRSKHALFIATVLILSLSILTESMLQRQKGLVFFCFFLLLFSSHYFNNKNRDILPIE